MALCAFSSSVQAERLKDVADLQGVRPNILTGYGLVVGLAGTGDDRQSSVGVQSIINMMKKLGAQVHLDRLRLPNVAAVVVTAELPAYVQPGQKLDVTVSSLGSAKSIEGGTLIITPLKGADLKVYAVAQGAISVGGFSAGGQSGSSVSKNHTTVGRVPDGAIVERAIPLELTGSELAINLRRPDFTTAVRLSDAIDKVLQASQKIKEAKKAEKLAAKEAAKADKPAPVEAPKKTPKKVVKKTTKKITPTPTPAEIEEGEVIERPEIRTQIQKTNKNTAAKKLQIVNPNTLSQLVDTIQPEIIYNH